MLGTNSNNNNNNNIDVSMFITIVFQFLLSKTMVLPDVKSMMVFRNSIIQ